MYIANDITLCTVFVFPLSSPTGLHHYIDVDKFDLKIPHQIFIGLEIAHKLLQANLDGFLLFPETEPDIFWFALQPI